MVQTMSLSEQIINELRNEILSGTLLPGQRLSIDELASKWGTSSTPVRDAIKHLESVGFLTIAPRRGVYVSNFDQRTFKDIFELRIAFECLAVESATERIPADELQRMIDIYQEGEHQLKENGDLSILIKNDHLIHDTIIKYSDNAKLVELIGDFQDLITWARLTVVTRHPNSYSISLPEHLEILDALKRRDPEAARIALKTHLKNALYRTLHSASDASGDE
jgi:DNA-binding GntR family transcriptional regulator